eukprot:CAMPEP_0198146214 /NCGR_PEP_ID=MMETSP1443-20131203/28190_1 /TAXON_ID=186043 /ORGANISM="Entomoneis sp., Strain CCMP2396" /LENGTH=206 /DNA_ID=CAMNT_0043810099 /DNA_START=54 /DNA_END=674 /DNA_ORIENTATION=+
MMFFVLCLFLVSTERVLSTKDVAAAEIEIEANGEIKTEAKKDPPAAMKEKVEKSAAVKEDCNCDAAVTAAIAEYEKDYDCSSEIAKAISVLASEKTALSNEVESKTKELKAVQTLKADMATYVSTLEENINQHKKDFAGIHEEHSLHKEDTSAELKDAKMKVASLQIELLKVQEQVKELSQVSFVKQFLKEMTDLWNQLVHKFNGK